MTLETITKAQLADHLRLNGESGKVSNRGVASLLRAPLARWGLSPKRAILRYARDQLRAAGLDDAERVAQVFAYMVALGECDEVYVGDELYVAPGEPRWMSVGENSGVYLHVSDPPDGIARASGGDHRDIVQRIRVETDDDAARLQLAGVREVSMAEWLSPIGYLRHATRRLGKSVRSDTVSLASFWDLLESELARQGLPLSADADVRAVTVAADSKQFFGRHDAANPEGRWTDVAPDGVWCAFRRGYGEQHWHPTLVAVNGGERRALDLFDRDEWHWALLARGRRFGSDEIVRRSNGSAHLTFPAPSQIRAGMDLVGVPTSAWGWELHPGAPDLWALLK
jgi:hypothetical protein